jgi:hypothetical protein
MIPLFTCRTCGFTCPSYEVYTFREDVRICHVCNDSIQAGDEQVAGRFKEAKELQCRLTRA